MRVLAIDCATTACSVALFENDALIAGHFAEIGRGHAERLVPLIASLPGRGRAAQIRVSLGPGSFTGVRIGLAAARALGLAWGADLRGYPTLALVAAMAMEAEPGPVSVAMIGGHGEFFVQDFGADAVPADEVTSLPPDSAARRVSHQRVAGNAAEVLEAKKKIINQDRLKKYSRFLAPLYGRAPDARPIAIPASGAGSPA